jgi:hypothetical protein
MIKKNALTLDTVVSAGSRRPRRTLPQWPYQNTRLRLLLFVTSLLPITTPSPAQNTLGALTKGTPVVAQTTGSSGATATSSSILFDATQFAGGTDLCGAPFPKLAPQQIYRPLLTVQTSTPGPSLRRVQILSVRSRRPTPCLLIVQTVARFCSGLTRYGSR